MNALAASMPLWSWRGLNIWMPRGSPPLSECSLSSRGRQLPSLRPLIPSTTRCLKRFLLDSFDIATTVSSGRARSSSSGAVRWPLDSDIRCVFSRSGQRTRYAEHLPRWGYFRRRRGQGEDHPSRTLARSSCGTLRIRQVLFRAEAFPPDGGDLLRL